MVQAENNHLKLKQKIHVKLHISLNNAANHCWLCQKSKWIEASCFMQTSYPPVHCSLHISCNNYDWLLFYPTKTLGTYYPPKLSEWVSEWIEHPQIWVKWFFKWRSILLFKLYTKHSHHYLANCQLIRIKCPYIIIR